MGFQAPVSIGVKWIIGLAGRRADLHVIIFDEIDAICKARGSVRDGSGVHDTIVNQVGGWVGHSRMGGWAQQDGAARMASAVSLLCLLCRHMSCMANDLP